MTPLGILEQQFRDLAACPRGPKVGVYLLIMEDEIVYVGSSTNIDSRISQHAREAREPQYSITPKPFERVLWYPIPGSLLDVYEGAFIRGLTPRLNMRAPRYLGHDNEILEGFGLPALSNPDGVARMWSEKFGNNLRLRPWRHHHEDDDETARESP